VKEKLESLGQVAAGQVDAKRLAGVGLVPIVSIAGPRRRVCRVPHIPHKYKVDF
jgi:hypothetical protein